MPEFPPLDLERRSTAEVVAAALRSRLLAGEYRPGAPMRESTLAPQLRVSRPTMREGLQLLVGEGLLTHHFHRGMVVTELSEEQIDDLYKVRMVIESAGVRAAAGRPRADFALLGAGVEALAAAHEQGDPVGIVEADMHFHELLVALIGSRRLSGFHSAALGQLRLALCQFDRTYGDGASQIADHRRLLRDLGSARTEVALERIERHLELSREQLLSQLAENGANGS